MTLGGDGRQEAWGESSPPSLLPVVTTESREARFCWGSCPVCGTLLGKPEKTNTIMKTLSFSYSPSAPLICFIKNVNVDTIAEVSHLYPLCPPPLLGLHHTVVSVHGTPDA